MFLFHPLIYPAICQLVSQLMAGEKNHNFIYLESHNRDAASLGWTKVGERREYKQALELY